MSQRKKYDPPTVARTVVSFHASQPDTSGDNTLGKADPPYQKINAEVWHRKVIADYERWKKNNP